MSERKDNFQKRKSQYWILLKGFWAYFFATEKYVEFYETKTAWVAMLLAVGFTMIMDISLDCDQAGKMVTSVQGLVANLISGFIGLLGFVVGGLALVSGTIDGNITERIEKNHKLKNLMGLLYSFCFHGGVVIITIISLSFIYLSSTLPYEIIDKYVVNRISLWIIIWIVSYLCLFSIFYSLTVLITCLRLFLLRYQYSKQLPEKNYRHVRKRI